MHSTLAAGLLPAGPITSVDDVYAWLRGLLEAVWRDPMCGDGVCESPWEFAQYGRFGCRADCGRLQDIQNLSAVQLDLSWTFAHPAGSIPATVRRGHCTWPARRCAPSMPDDANAQPLGPAALNPRRSSCRKPAGTCVLPATAAAATGATTRGLTAWQGAPWWWCQTCQMVRVPPADLRWQRDQQEPACMWQGPRLLPLCAGRWSLVVKRYIFSKVSGGVRAVPLLEQQALAAKVAAAQVAARADHSSERAVLAAVVQAGRVAALELVSAVLQQTYEAAVAAAAEELQAGVLDTAGFDAAVDAAQQQLDEDLAELHSAAASCPGLAFSQPDPAAPPAPPATCDRIANLTEAAQQEQLAGMVALVLGRLVPAAAAADAALDAELASLQQSAPELYAVVAASRGQNASLPAAATAAALQQLYVEPLPAPAKVALTGHAIRTDGVTAAALVDRAEARMQEIDAAQAAVLQLPEVQAALALTAPSGGLQYNYTAWAGGSDMYNSCNLQRCVRSWTAAGQSRAETASWDRGAGHTHLLPSSHPTARLPCPQLPAAALRSMWAPVCRRRFAATAAHPTRAGARKLLTGARLLA